MSRNKSLVILRLQKQEKRLHDEPLDQAWVEREGLLNFHFCVHGLDSPYKGGFYHGVLQLSEEYPFAPPKLMFFTPSGRFEVAKPICTTFTNFHKESWTSSWTVRTMVLATISFMTSEEYGAGSINNNSVTRSYYAQNSMEHNMKNPLFTSLFKKQLALPGLLTIKNKQQNPKNQKCDPIQVQQSHKLYGLYGGLVLLLIIWLIVHN